MMMTESAPETYLLENTDENHPHADVRFRGSLLSHVSSRRGGRSTRWSEIKIFRTVGQRYVVQTIGCTADPDEQPISRLTISMPAGDLHTLQELATARQYTQSLRRARRPRATTLNVLPLGDVSGNLRQSVFRSAIAVALFDTTLCQ